MAGLAAGRERPAIGRSPRNRSHVLALINDQAFEIESHISTLARRDQIGTRNLQRIADIFLVAGEDNLDIGILQDSRRMHGVQRREHHHHPALVIANPGAFGLFTVSHECLKR